MNIIPVHTEICHMHEYNTEVYTRQTYMHGYTLACTHTHTHTHTDTYMFAYVYYRHRVVPVGHKATFIGQQ